MFYRWLAAFYADIATRTNFPASATTTSVWAHPEATGPKSSFLTGNIPFVYSKANAEKSKLRVSACCNRVEDVQAVINELTVGPVIIVSLSMGGWLSLVAAQATPAIRDRLSGMVLYAPAINYVYPYYQYHRSQLGEETRKRLDEGTYVRKKFLTSYMPLHKLSTVCYNAILMACEL